MRRIVQIAVAGTEHNSSTQANALILALCEDGSLWSTTDGATGWQHWELPPDQQQAMAPLPEIKPITTVLKKL